MPTAGAAASHALVFPLLFPSQSLPLLLWPPLFSISGPPSPSSRSCSCASSRSCSRRARKLLPSLQPPLFSSLPPFFVFFALFLLLLISRRRLLLLLLVMTTLVVEVELVLLFILS